MLVPRDTDFFSLFFRNFRNEDSNSEAFQNGEIVTRNSDEKIVILSPPPSVKKFADYADLSFVPLRLNEEDAEPENNGFEAKIFSYFQMIAGDHLAESAVTTPENEANDGAFRRLFEMNREKAAVEETEERLKIQEAEIKTETLLQNENRIFEAAREISTREEMNFYENFIRDDEARHAEYLERRKTQIETTARELEAREAEIRRDWRKKSKKKSPIKRYLDEVGFLAGLLSGAGEGLSGYGAHNPVASWFDRKIFSTQTDRIGTVAKIHKIQPIRRGEPRYYRPFEDFFVASNIEPRKKRPNFTDQILFLNAFYRKERILRRGRDPPFHNTAIALS